MNRRGGLGRGLAALIPPGEAGVPTRASLAELPLDAIQPNPRQPREVFDDAELDGLATSIADLGVLQPVVVRPLGEDIYELIAGERRLRAAKRAGLERIPAVVRHTEDGQLLKEALVENIHRVQLNPLEEAAAYQQLLDDFGFTQEELAGSLGKSRPAVSNTLRLLQLPPAVQRRVAAGVLTAGHAKALLALSDDQQMDRFATRTVNEGLSVRALEELIRLTLLEPKDPSTRRRSRARNDAPGLIELQDDLSDALDARVRIQVGARRGKLQVEFRSVDDLERIVGVIARGLEDGASAEALPTTDVSTVVADPGDADDPAPTDDPGTTPDLPADRDPDASGTTAAPDTSPDAGIRDGAPFDEASAATVGGDPLDLAEFEADLDVAGLDDDELEELTRPDRPA
jgi:ParB family transcriptional regulator, chromosome partitioning protein